MDVVRFVDSVAASPTVRLNLNDDTWTTLANDTGFPPPPLRYVTSATSMLDGARVPAATYDNRIVRLHLQLETAAGGDVQATQIQNLARELNRTRNILQWQSASMTTPVFFRTYRASVSTVLEYMPTLREATVEIPAEPFAYGLKQTLSPVTVYNDPVEGTTLNANPYFETNAASWTVTGGTFVRSTAQFHEGAASGLLTPDGVTATVEVGSELVAGTAGRIYRASSWVRCAVTRSINLGFNWYNGAQSFLSADTSSFALTANTWTFIHVTFAAPASTGFVQMKFQETGTPPGSNTLHVDESRINVPGTAGGACLEISGVKGDVETPAIISMPADTVYSASGDRQSLFATRRRGTPSNAPYVVQAEACTQGTDMATQANDTAMSGAGNNFSRYTPATSPTVLAKRLTVAAPPDSTDLRGTYRVLVRYRKSVSGDVFGVQMRWGTSAGGTLVLDEVTLPSGTNVRYADLGYVSYPVGADPITDGYSGVQRVLAGMTCEIWARRVSGTGNLDFDFMLWVPADDSTCYVSWVSANDSTQKAVLDGAGEDPAPASTAYLLNTAGSMYAMAPRTPIGGVPLLAPGATNRIVFVRDVGTTASTTDPIGSNTAVTVSYFPRYLYVAPATT